MIEIFMTMEFYAIFWFNEKVGITTEEIDRFVHSETIKANAYPSPLRYAAFPKSVCTSVNNVVCHGIPDDRPLADGDIINVDVTVNCSNWVVVVVVAFTHFAWHSIQVFHNGFHGDCSQTFLVGNVDEKGRFLVDITEECLYKAISLCGPDVPFNRIGACIEEHAEKNGLAVVAEFVGHGIGTYFHGPPAVCHYGECRKSSKISNNRNNHFILGSQRFSRSDETWYDIHHRTDSIDGLAEFQNFKGRMDSCHQRQFTNRSIRTHNTNHEERMRGVDDYRFGWMTPLTFTLQLTEYI